MQTTSVQVLVNQIILSFVHKPQILFSHIYLKLRSYDWALPCPTRSPSILQPYTLTNYPNTIQIPKSILNPIFNSHLQSTPTLTPSPSTYLISNLQRWLQRRNRNLPNQKYFQENTETPIPHKFSKKIPISSFFHPLFLILLQPATLFTNTHQNHTCATNISTLQTGVLENTPQREKKEIFH